MDKSKSAPLANAAVLAIAFLMYALLVSPLPVMKLAKASSAPVYRWPDEDKVSPVCLVSWDSSHLEGILDALIKADARITFAVTGEWALQNADTARRIVTDGHGLALLLGEKTPSSGELVNEAETVKAVSGEAPLVAVCSVKKAEAQAESCTEAGLKPVVVSVDLGGAFAGGTEFEELLDGIRAGGCTIGFLPTSDAAERLPDFIEIIKNMGYGIVPAHKMLYNYTDKI